MEHVVQYHDVHKIKIWLWYHSNTMAATATAATKVTKTFPMAISLYYHMSHWISLVNFKWERNAKVRVTIDLVLVWASSYMKLYTFISYQSISLNFSPCALMRIFGDKTPAWFKHHDCTSTCTRSLYAVLRTPMCTALAAMHLEWAVVIAIAVGLSGFFSCRNRISTLHELKIISRESRVYSSSVGNY